MPQNLKRQAPPLGVQIAVQFVLCVSTESVDTMSTRSLVPSTPEYTYRAVVVDVIDGDTIRAEVDLGFSITSKQVLRLLTLDTPEVVGASKAEGLKAKAELAERILGKTVIIQTIRDKREKYGRYLVMVFLGEVNINAWMAERWPTYQ